MSASTPSDATVLALDVGGTKLAAGLLGPDNQLRLRQETPTRAEEKAEAIFSRLLALARRLLVAEDEPVAAIGVASAGQIDPDTGDVVFATDNLPGWTGLRLGRRLAQALALPVYVENDVNCFALAESVLGAGQGYRHLLLVAVGTGVGGGIIANGELYSGSLGRGGEVGHMRVDPSQDRPCTCGLAGCLEVYAATRIILAHSEFDSIHELAAYYRAGGEIPAVDEAALWLGRGLASLAHILGPEAILVGGSVGLLGAHYLEAVRASFKEHAMQSYRTTPILPNQLAADSGLLGAGILARRRLAESR